ncbi:MAG: DUF72 domain-containing protein, partial [Solirubrobacteraceae bacterium]
SYAEWRGTFYPQKLAPARMLSAYAEQLGAVELNNTFQRTPTEGALAAWAERTPPGFRFCVKAHRALTYSAAAFPKETVAADLHGRLGVLGPRLGPVLLQFPPTRQLDPALLDRLLAALDLPAAAEFRHDSWFTDEVYDLLRRHGAALCVTEGEKWPQAPPRELASFAYVRLRAERYGKAALEAWRARLRSLAAVHDDVYAFVRHGPDAPRIALALSVD